jgi:hypothetical protein
MGGLFIIRFNNVVSALNLFTSSFYPEGGGMHRGKRTSFLFAVVLAALSLLVLAQAQIANPRREGQGIRSQERDEIPRRRAA